MTTAAPALSVEGLSVEFRTRSGIVRALDNVSFAVDKGETSRWSANPDRANRSPPTR